MAKKTKDAFHKKHNYNEYSYENNGITITFWAKDDTDAELYKKKVGAK